MGLSWGKIGRVVKYLKKITKYKKSCILNAYFPFSCIEVNFKLALKLMGSVEMLNVLWVFAQIVTHVYGCIVPCRARDWYTFVGSTVFMCEHSPSPSEVQENLALFAILTQWLRLLGFLSGCCNFSDEFPAEGQADAEQSWKKQIYIFKASENGRFQSCCKVRCITSANVSD